MRPKRYPYSRKKELNFIKLNSSEINNSRYRVHRLYQQFVCDLFDKYYHDKTVSIENILEAVKVYAKL